VLETAAHELQWGDPVDALVAGAEDDLVVVDVEQAVVGDGHTMGVQARVAEEHWIVRRSSTVAVGLR
jgi:hypothetical protein